ncbi:hypothetical protein YC2023_098746 [Brassica napus]
MLDFFKVFGNLQNESGNKGIVRWRHWDSISKKGVKGFAQAYQYSPVDDNLVLKVEHTVAACYLEDLNQKLVTDHHVNPCVQLRRPWQMEPFLSVV